MGQCNVTKTLERDIIEIAPSWVGMVLRAILSGLLVLPYMSQSVCINKYPYSPNV